MASGSDVAVELDRRLKASQVMLALIGPHWCSEAGPSGRCIDDPADPVRRELAAAFANNLLVIPILVGGATMPPASVLPAELASLSGIQAQELSEERWEYDVKHLADRLFELPLFDLERKLDAIDRQWEIEKQQYLIISDKEGHTREPSPRHTGVIIVASFFAVVWLALGSSFRRAGPTPVGLGDSLISLFMLLVGPAMAVVMIGFALGERRQYRRFKAARDAYQRRRAMLFRP